MKKLKILVISHLYPTAENPNRGIFVHKMNLALKDLGCEIDVISPQVFGKGRREKSKGEVDGIKVFYPGHLSFSRHAVGLSSYLAWQKSRKLFEEKYDVIVAHTAIPDGYIAKKLAKKLKVPYFVYVHGADVQHKINYSGSAKKIIKNILISAKKVFANSSKTQKLLKSELGIKSVVVPMGVEPRKSVKKAQKKGKICLISVCNLEKEKGIQYVIDALKSMKEDIEYLIIGDGTFKVELEKMAQGENRIDFLGRIPHKEIFKYLDNSNVFVLPSYNEAFGVVYLEAMQAGIPVIGVRGEGIEDVFNLGEAGILVEPKNSDSVKNALQILISDDKLRERLGQNGVRIVNEYYLWPRIIENFYKEITN